MAVRQLPQCLTSLPMEGFRRNAFAFPVSRCRMFDRCTMNGNDRAYRHGSICALSLRTRQDRTGIAGHAGEHYTEIRGANPMNKMLKRAAVVPALLALSIAVAQADTLTLYTSQPE